MARPVPSWLLAPSWRLQVWELQVQQALLWLAQWLLQLVLPPLAQPGPQLLVQLVRQLEPLEPQPAYEIALDYYRTAQNYLC